MSPSKLVRISVIFLSLQMLSTMLQAETFRARIVKVEGQVHILNSDGEKRAPEKKQFLVNNDETVLTAEDSLAVVQFEDGAMSVLDEKSSLRVEQSGWLSQLGGKVYYIFRKAFAKDKTKKVKTKFATIGIRGTTFIVDATKDSQSIALQEGKLNIESPDTEYEIHREKPVVDDFAAFKQQVLDSQQAMRDEYADYKKQLADEFVEYKKSFDMRSNQVVSFTGKKVTQATLGKDWHSSFDRFNHFSREFNQAYRELNREAELSEEDFY